MGQQWCVVGVAVLVAGGCLPADDGFHAKVAAGCHSAGECNALRDEADRRLRECMSNAATSSLCKDAAYDDAYRARGLAEEQERADRAAAREAHQAQVKADDDELAALNQAQQNPDDSCEYIAGLRDKAATSAHFSKQYSDLAQQRHDAGVSSTTSQIQWVLARAIDLRDADDPNTALDDIPKARAEVEQLRCYDAGAALKAQADVDTWAAARQKAVVDEQTCRMKPACMGARIAVPLCQAIAVRRGAAEGIAHERANPAGVVNLATLHELGEQIQDNDAVIANLKAKYVAATHRAFIETTCPKTCSRAPGSA